jgi:BirA family biotin operon repressor/biotin-[acetyl-CoA-carboxylase] ligase
MPPEERAAAAELPRVWTEALHRAPPRTRVARHVLFFDAAGSTNDIAATLAAEEEASGLAVIADTQTRGRGRLGRQWFSPPGSGLYVSLVLSPGTDAGEPERAIRLLTLMAGVALAEAIETVTGLAPSIKWPNDLLIGPRKLAGILAEMVNREIRLKPDPTQTVRLKPDTTSAPIILGYGINVGLAAYPPELADRATSLERELGRPIDREATGAATLTAIDRRYADLAAGRFDAILDAWRARAVGHRGGRVAWDTTEGERRGVTDDIDAWGALLVRTDRGVERLVAGEVRWDSF